MSISASLLPEFDMEMGNLRKTLERVPADRPPPGAASFRATAPGPQTANAPPSQTPRT